MLAARKVEAAMAEEVVAVTAAAAVAVLLVLSARGGAAYELVCEPQETSAAPIDPVGLTLAGIDRTCAGLTTLDLSSVQIYDVLPSSFFNETTNLEKLIISQNYFKGMEAGIFDPLTQLQFVNLGYNSIKNVPDALLNRTTELTSLNLADNFLYSLSSDFFDTTTALGYLNLSANSLDGLPDGVFHHMGQALESLDLSSNSLTALQMDTFKTLSGLTFLDLHGNNLTELPIGIFDQVTALTYLDISRNQIESLPFGIFSRNKQLQYLYHTQDDGTLLCSDTGLSSADLDDEDNSLQLRSCLPNELTCYDTSRCQIFQVSYVIEVHSIPFLDLDALDAFRANVTAGIARNTGVQTCSLATQLLINETVLFTQATLCTGSYNAAAQYMETVSSFCSDGGQLLQGTLIENENATLSSLTLTKGNLTDDQGDEITKKCQDAGTDSSGKPAINSNSNDDPSNPPRHSKSKKRSLLLPIVLSCGAAAITIIAVLAALSMYKRRGATRGSPPGDSQPTNSPNDVFLNSIQELTPTDIELEHAIGGGGYGTVYKALWRDSAVAVKRIVVNMENPKSRKEIRKELEALCKYRHPNVVYFYGHYVQLPYVYFAMEYMARGSLYRFIYDEERTSELTAHMIMKIAKDIANGMQYLHDHFVIHRDLKTQNILITEDLSAKVADFGIAYVSQKMAGPRSRRGTPNYMAPEVLTRTRYNNKVDIWSFGCILSELTVLEPPFSKYEEYDIHDAVVHRRETPEIPIPTSNFEVRMGDLIKRCCSFEPSHRPNFSEITKSLKTLEQSGATAVPLLPIRCGKEKVRSSGRGSRQAAAQSRNKDQGIEIMSRLEEPLLM